ncbi:MAG TPA: tail fiber domain-containing protein [Candidatus Udaeobacter sp.]|nr:tail fiber domain-containing protein [Candidatus Udaeobacter sp.]
MNDTTRLIRTLTGWPTFRCRLILVILTLAGSTLLPEADAVNPPPDGGYVGFNTAEGQNALLSLDTSTGFANTAVGSFSLQSSLDSSFNTGIGAGTLSLNTGNENTAVGAAALLLNTTGEDNTAVGVDALLNNTTGEANTAIGDDALLSNTTGGSNTANGALALVSNTVGTDNTGIGDNALASNTTGSLNTATGVAALVDNTGGGSNTATGVSALAGNTTGNNNTATGVAALVNNTDGSSNTATGLSALHDNTLGESNTANGNHALFANTEGSGNTAMGDSALSNITTGSSNTALGENAGDNLTSSDSNNVDIGFDVHGVAGESNTIRIGNPNIATTFIRGISGQTIASGDPVLVAANGQLGTATSSKRFKDDIRPMDKASETLFSLKPVTFRYRKEIDPRGTRQFGLVAEDVEKLNPDLVVRDERGRVNSVRYDQVNAMLLNEFLKEHRRGEEQNSKLEEQARRIQEQEATIMALKEEMETVAARLEEKDTK